MIKIDNKWLSFILTNSLLFFFLQLHLYKNIFLARHYGMRERQAIDMNDYL